MKKSVDSRTPQVSSKNTLTENREVPKRSLEKAPMSPKGQVPKITSSDMDDMIRHKAVKAQREKRQSLLNFSIGMIMSLLAVTIMIEWKFYDESEVVQLGEVKENFDEIIEIPITEQLPPPPPAKVQHAKIVEVEDTEVILEDIEVDLDIDMAEETVVDEVNMDMVSGDAPVEETTDEVFLFVEEKPAPVGGMAAFYQFLGEHIKYPKDALRNDIEGRVYVQFVVDKDGHLNDIKVVKGIGFGCDEEAVRVIKSAPAWTPGKQRGQAVKVQMIIPVQFKMQRR